MGKDSASADNLIWIDLEMTGLDTGSDTILEIATIVTDSQLNELAVGPEIAIRHPLQALQAMDEWNTRHHGQSGLWQRALDSTHDAAAAERETLTFLSEWTVKGASPMCGNSICQDRRFLHRLMPELEAWFHYRNLDVSTLKELARRWNPSILESLVKENRHTALSDIRESVTELRHYRQFMGGFAGES
ncbi:oligoribonuclease [Marinihelvus fidelis]|uniref:Oligoribonuclease n=1 Tax=Marinihelvus fidelis TaxID=2613842 RepID=A0A5N0TFE1_9GAMM|nr:oligoribonuclease [Marinihelvus fidelis]KAA9133184.1 oligoribonuclease [Marinihelvus fidelis]